MEDLYDNREGCARFVRTIATVIGILIAVVLFFVACTTPKPIIRTEYRDWYKTDTVQVTDSFYQYRYVYLKGDTVYIHDSIDRWRIKKALVKEYIHDSIDRPVEILIEKPKTSFEQAACRSGYALWGLIAIAIIIGIVKLLMRFHII